jgi:hypothetical protein
VELVTSEDAALQPAVNGIERTPRSDPTITFSISRTDCADLVRLLDETDGRLPYTEMRKALNTRTTSGEVRMATRCGEELLDWLRGRAQTGRVSSATADLERALLFGRVALVVQRALTTPRHHT